MPKPVVECPSGVTVTADNQESAEKAAEAKLGQYRNATGDGGYVKVVNLPGSPSDVYCLVSDEYIIPTDVPQTSEPEIKVNVTLTPSPTHVSTLVPPDSQTLANKDSGAEFDGLQLALTGVLVVAVVLVIGGSLYIGKKAHEIKSNLVKIQQETARALTARNEQENLTLEEVRAHQEAVQTRSRNEIARKLLFQFLTAAGTRLRSKADTMSTEGQKIKDYLESLGAPADWKTNLETTHYLAIHKLLSGTAHFLLTSGVEFGEESKEFSHQADRVREPANPKTSP